MQQFPSKDATIVARLHTLNQVYTILKAKEKEKEQTIHIEDTQIGKEIEMLKAVLHLVTKSKRRQASINVREDTYLKPM